MKLLDKSEHWTIYTSKDAREYEEPKYVFLDDGIVYIQKWNDDERNHYSFQIKRAKTYREIIGWLHQLSEKAWFDAIRANQLIELLCKHNKLDFYLNS
jgi:hypothetical protein